MQPVSLVASGGYTLPRHVYIPGTVLHDAGDGHIALPAGGLNPISHALQTMPTIPQGMNTHGIYTDGV